MFADVGCTPGAPTALDASSAASALALAPAQASAIASAPRDADTGGGAGSGAGGAAASCGAAAFFKLRWSAPATAGEAPPHGYRISRRVVAANTTAGGAMSSSGAGSNGSVRAEAEEDAWLFSHRITRRGALVGIPHAARGAGGAIHVRVQAWNFVGGSAWSDIATFHVAPDFPATATSGSGGGDAAGKCSSAPSTVVDAAEVTGLEMAKFSSLTFSVRRFIYRYILNEFC